MTQGKYARSLRRGRVRVAAVHTTTNAMLHFYPYAMCNSTHILEYAAASDRLEQVFFISVKDQKFHYFFMKTSYFKECIKMQIFFGKYRAF